MDNFQYDLYGEMYAGTAVKVGKYGFPQLAEENYIPTKQVKPFNYLLSAKNLILLIVFTPKTLLLDSCS